jgi:hypothetical protein
MHTKFLSKDLKGRDHSEDLGKDGKNKSQWFLKKWFGRTETSGRLLRT